MKIIVDGKEIEKPDNMFKQIDGKWYAKVYNEKTEELQQKIDQIKDIYTSMQFSAPENYYLWIDKLGEILGDKELNIGDYVRSKEGFIAKITDIKDFCGNKVVNFDKYIDGAILKAGDTYIVGMLLENTKDLKHSTNIIDLIRVGDYVNGCHITYIDEPDKYNSNRILYFEEPQDYVIKTFTNEEIKSIVTKEQFERNEYKI